MTTTFTVRAILCRMRIYFYCILKCTLILLSKFNKSDHHMYTQRTFKVVTVMTMLRFFACSCYWISQLISRLTLPN